jgi:hypothetical protein
MDTYSAVCELSKRIEKLERGNRWWRRAALASALTLIALLTIAQAPSPTAVKILRASRFVLVNDVGNDVAELGLVDHLPALSFLDGTKHPMTQLTASNLSFGMTTDSEFGRINLGANGLSIVGRKKEGTRQVPRFLLDITSGPNLTMLGDNPTVDVTDVTHALRLNALPSVELSDGGNKPKTILGRFLRYGPTGGDVQQITDTGVGSLSLLDEKGTTRLQVVGGAYPNFLVFDEQGRYRAVIGRTLPPPPEPADSPYSATILDDSQGVVWRVPAK